MQLPKCFPPIDHRLEREERVTSSEEVLRFPGRLQSNLKLSQKFDGTIMNLDSLSFALSQISYSVANLTKKNYKSSVAEISHVSRSTHDTGSAENLAYP